MRKAAVFTILVMCGSLAIADMRITEWMYGGENGEFVEFTNTGAAAVDMTGWSYDDDSRLPGGFDLSEFGLVMPGQSVIITESAAEDFRTAWGLSASVKILGEYSNNLGRNDEINLFDPLENLVDRLTYGDQDIPGSIRTNGASGNIPAGSLGLNDAMAAALSALGDGYGSWTSAGGDIANPGAYIPEPATLALLAAGAGLIRKRRRQ